MELIKCSANLFSGVSLIIILIAFFSAIDLSAKTQITGFLAILCLIYSSYKVWNDAVAKIPSGDNFKIISKGSSFRPHAFLGDGRIDSKSYFTINFDFINRFDQSIVLHLPEIKALSIDGELFASKPTNIYFKESVNSIASINFPYSIEKHSRKSIRCQIDVPMLVSDRIAFAEKLSRLNKYKIAIKFLYEDMSTTTTTETIELAGTFDDFKKEILSFWKEKQHFELICKATGSA